MVTTAKPTVGNVRPFRAGGQSFTAYADGTVYRREPSLGWLSEKGSVAFRKRGGKFLDTYGKEIPGTTGKSDTEVAEMVLRPKFR